MFLDEQAGRISFDVPSGPLKAPVGGVNGEAKKVFKSERPIVKPMSKNGTTYISAFVRVTDRSAVSELEALGVEIECEFSNGTLYTTLIPVDKIQAVADIAKVTYINVATMKRPFTNAARQYSNVDDVLTYSASAREAGLPNAYDGSGVLLGVIDTGIDFQHRAFKDADGNSRIKRAYVVTATYNSQGYITNITENDYGDGLSNAITTSQPTTDDDTEDHGTHTSSTAGGSSVIINAATTTVTPNHANATYGGMAPGADLYLAGTPLAATLIANAFQKICNYADQKGMPVVVSNSWGAQNGPHDGSGEIAEIVNQYFGDSHPNHICLFAASNDAGTNGFHVMGNASSSSPLGTVLNYNSDYGLSYYYGTLGYAWTRSTGKTLACKLIVIDSSGTKKGEVSVSASSNGTQVSGLSDYVSYGSLYAYSASQNGKSCIELYTSGLQMKSGYKLAVQFYPTSGNSIIDLWSSSAYTYYTSTPSTSGYTWTAGSDDMCVSDEATYENAISIGAYSTKNKVSDYNGTNHNLSEYTVGDIAYFSSYATADQSPTGKAQPWISAPGATVVSAVNHYDTNGDLSFLNGNSAQYGFYRVNRDTSNPYGSMEGTSMATPAAAGIVALWLQAANTDAGKVKYPNGLTINDVKEIMKETAITDSYTNGAHASHFGHGKIDALAGIKYIIGDATPTPTIITQPARLDFDEIPAGASATRTIKVTGANLEGDISVALSGDNFEISSTSVTKADAEGDGGIITITFTAPARVTGTYNANVTFSSQNATSVTVPLVAKGKYNAPTITATPTSLDFGEITAGTSTTKTFTVTGANLEGNISLAVSGANFAISSTNVTKTVAQGSGATITVTFTAPARASATYNGTVTLTSSNASNVTVSLTGKGKYVPPVISATPSNVTFDNVTVGEAPTQTLHISATNPEGIVMLTLNDDNGVFKLSHTTIPVNDAAAGKDVTVTFTPKANVNYEATVTLASTNAQSVTVPLSGNGAYTVPVMQPADTTRVKNTSFRADWTDQTLADNVASYTLWVDYVPPVPPVQLLGTLDGSGYTGSYSDITLTAPWGGKNVRGGNEAIYFRNSSSWGSTSYGNITYTIPVGYENATFTTRITTHTRSYGAGNLTVATPQTSAVGHSFSAGETHDWLVTASSGEKITITSTDNSYSPDIALIEIYSGDATAANAPLRAVETGDSTYRVVEGITTKFYVVSDLIGGGTYTYKVKAIYTNQTESEWSNEETVTLKDTPDEPEEGLLGDVNLDGVVDITDVNIVINIILQRDQAENYDRRAYVTDDDMVDVSDVNAIINIILRGESGQ
ncbi:MAG: S8 family serine peptidase [Muribaculaceae bacterium]|nr:S8 family serine peptidase [Muribaculaceae bacterium]